MKKTKVKMNKPVYLGISILDISKTLMYEFWYDYGMIILNQRTKTKQNYATWILIVLLLIFLLKTFLKILMMLKDGLIHLPRPMGMNKKVIGVFKDELGGKILKEFCALRAKTYTYLMDDDSEKNKAKGIKRCVIKRKLMFENYKNSLFNNKCILQSQLRFKSNHHNVYTEEVNKIALNSNDDKTLQTFDRVTTYPYGTNAFKLCESEMLSKIRCNV